MRQSLRQIIVFFISFCFIFNTSSPFSMGYAYGAAESKTVFLDAASKKQLPFAIQAYVKERAIV